MFTVLFPVAALIGLLGLCRIAPRRHPLLYAAPVSATAVGILALAAVGMALTR
ncbi:MULTISPECIES: hypothetical protein [unclassified Streptomyces]|uniref:hypothetical protein n=1 Tax=unclassified Streptomyces TaxID=2593676 RepID=UPI003BB7A25A